MTAPKAEEVISEMLVSLIPVSGSTPVGAVTAEAQCILTALRAAAPDGDGEAVVLVDRPGAPIVRMVEGFSVRECVTCGGTGLIEGTVPPGMSVGQVSCPVCNDTGHVRVSLRFAEPAPEPEA